MQSITCLIKFFGSIKVFNKQRQQQKSGSILVPPHLKTHNNLSSSYAVGSLSVPFHMANGAGCL